MNGNDIPFPKKKFLFVSLESLSGDLAWTLVKEGHEVKAHIKASGDVGVYEGFIERVDDWKPFVDWADVIVFDDVGYGKIQDELRSAGFAVFGGCELGDKLELDRVYSQQVMRENGLQSLET